MTKTPTVEECIARGMTALETAKALGVSWRTAYRRANAKGLKFGPVREDMTQAEFMAYMRSHADPEYRIQRIREALTAQLDAPRNGYTWAELHRAGYTAGEAARARGQNINRAYYWSNKMGLRWAKHSTTPRTNPLAGLSQDELREYYRLRSAYRYKRAEALRILGRSDLIDMHRPVANRDEDIQRAKERHAARMAGKHEPPPST